MKIKVKSTVPPMTYDDVVAIPKPRHRLPKKPALLFRFLMKMLGSSDLKQTEFEAEYIGIDAIPKEPCLILMNHSSFIDLEIAAKLIYPKPFSIVCTSDGFVGKEWLMRNLGCIPTNKFIPDPTLISDIKYALHKNRNHVLMYPEASYSFDGRATALPRKLGVVLKLLGVPVIMITTHGAFTRDPLYNMLQKRNVKVTAEVTELFSKESLKSKTVSEIDFELDAAFSFDSFIWQKENKIKIDEDFRADGLERILFRCPVCGR
ncbi:MAG: 1-acyl-sn-glycerol-3-phosphate acyltransferase, partial [Clostridia bacterium]|nr:1-acyl-sn-glycerol-3-phosphate acyltransferase [Clostridia bacterium]